MNLRGRILAGLMLALAASPAFAAKPPAKPVDIPALTQQAQNGDAGAEVKLGSLYENGGNGVARDYTQALQWYQKAADQGNLPAKYDLAMMYFNGKGMAKDFTKAAGLLQDPANGGMAAAQYRLGYLYAHGQGVQFQDYKTAAEWLTRAANQNDTQAQIDLGDLCFNGSGVAQSYEDAYFWHLVAGAHKLGAGQQKAEALKIARLKTALTQAQMESAQARAAAWKPVMEKPPKNGQK
jgi:TPR repeat protein